jgi:hypothetical protein
MQDGRLSEGAPTRWAYEAQHGVHVLLCRDSGQRATRTGEDERVQAPAAGADVGLDARASVTCRSAARAGSGRCGTSDQQRVVDHVAACRDEQGSALALGGVNGGLEGFCVVGTTDLPGVGIDNTAIWNSIEVCDRV